MTSNELLKAKLAGEQTARELFCPAVYEHKARLIDESISEVANNAKLLEEAVLAEYEIYQPDVLTVGIDIYNVEAEALGAEIVYSEKADAVPSIKDKILKDISGVGDLCLPDVSRAGRIPLLLEVAHNINAKLGVDIFVRGGLSGPYSIAAELMGIEPLMMAMMMDKENCRRLLDFTTSVVIAYGKEYIKRGVSVCMFDSQASPPLISPDMFEKILLPRYQKIANEFKTAGCECVELVVGGKTDSIAGYVLQSGFDIVLSDYVCDAKIYFADDHNALPLIRRNINPVMIENGEFAALQDVVSEIHQLASNYKNLIIGTGVLSYNVCSENILKIKEMCLGKYER